MKGTGAAAPVTPAFFFSQKKKQKKWLGSDALF
jgi:hypothetical protein